MNFCLLYIVLVRYLKMDENDIVIDVGKGSKEFFLYINIIKCFNFFILYLFFNVFFFSFFIINVELGVDVSRVRLFGVGV